MTLEEKYKLSCYEELTTLDNHTNVSLVKSQMDGKLYVKKILHTFDEEVYEGLAGMQLSGIPRIYELWKDNGTLIVIEEYIQGDTVERRLSMREMKEEMARDVFLQLCHVLKNLHHANPPLIHRDIKPSNLILTKENQLYLIDFNAMREYQEDMTEDTRLIGTKEYAAPEQYGFCQSDGRTDIYGAGIVLNQMLTGKLPKEELAKGELGKVVTTCTQMDPEHRYQDISEVIAACERKKRKKEKVSLTLPGFRTKKPWKMVLAVLGYFLLLDMCFTMAVTDGNNQVVTNPNRILLNRIFFAIFFLVWMWVPAGYLDSYHRLPGLKKLKKQPWKFIVACVYGFGLGSLAILFLLILENVFW